MTKPILVEGLRRRTEVPVDRSWNARILAGVERRVRRGQVARRAGAGLAVLLLVGGFVGWRSSRSAHDGTSVAMTGAATGATTTVQFDPGAVGRLIGTASHAEVTERSSAHTTVAVRSGAVAFDIAHTGREFRVEVGSLRVVVLGTAFVVDRRADAVAVSVQRGQVRVEDNGETAVLGAGEERSFVTTKSPATAVATTPPATEPAPEPSGPSRQTPVVERPLRRTPSRWAVLANRGDYRRAYRLLHQEGGKPREDVEELLLAADVARRSSHFAEALPYYDRVIDLHPSDPRAALAALTKGRIALHQLVQPREAAVAFARARALSRPEGARAERSLPEGLIEEAMIGEATAWRRAGETAKARAVAADFVRRYPHSPSVEAVRRLGEAHAKE